MKKSLRKTLLMVEESWGDDLGVRRTSKHLKKRITRMLKKRLRLVLNKWDYEND